MDQNRKSAASAGAFFGVGAALAALSATGQPALFGVGVAFLALGVVFMVRALRARR